MEASAKHLIPFSQVEQLRAGREIVRHEAEALLDLSRNLDASFLAAVDLLKNCHVTCEIGVSLFLWKC